MTSLKQHPPMRFVALAFVGASVLLIPRLVPAQDWRVQVGAQSKDKALQVIAFLPNELWIHAGDSIAFKVATDEPHTVTFLTPNQCSRPSRSAVQAQRRAAARKMDRAV
jgi:plastocyanin